MRNYRTLLLLTALIIVAVLWAFRTFTANDLSGYGSLLSAGAGLLAVLWFTASLRCQAIQLEEQRTQFSTQLNHLLEANRRDALLMAKDILDTAEKKAIAHNGSITAIGDLTANLLDFSALKVVMDGEDPAIVMNAAAAWLKKEGAAIILLKGIKSASEVYFRSIGRTDIDFTKEPEVFVHEYGPLIWGQPFFDGLQGTASMLCNFLIKLEPGRKSALIAFFVASSQVVNEKVIHMDKVLEDIQTHVDKGYSLPRIAQLFWDRKRQATLPQGGENHDVPGTI